MLSHSREKDSVQAHNIDHEKDVSILRVRVSDLERQLADKEFQLAQNKGLLDSFEQQKVCYLFFSFLITTESLFHMPILAKALPLWQPTKVKDTKVETTLSQEVLHLYLDVLGSSVAFTCHNLWC